MAINLDVSDPFAKSQDSSTPPPSTETSTPAPQTQIPRPRVSLDVGDPFEIQRPTASIPKPTSTLGDLWQQAKGTATSATGEILRGAADVGQRLNEAIPIGRTVDEAIGLTPEKTRAAGESLENKGQAMAANVSPEFAEATNKGLLDEGGLTPTNIASKAVTSVASMAPALGAAALNPAIGVGAFGLQGEAAGRKAGEQQVTNLTDEQLAAVPRYQELVKSGMNPVDARAQLSQEVADRQAGVQGAFGAALGLVGRVPGVSALGEGIANTITRPTARVLGDSAGKFVADRVGAGAAEAAGFAGLNAGGQVLSNVTNPIPTDASEGVAEAAASGVAPGFLLGAAHGIHRPIPRYPEAAPGSMADAANAIPERPRAAEPPAAASDFVGDAQGNVKDQRAGAPQPQAAEQVQEAAPPSDQRVQPNVPWFGPEPGEFRQPTENELKDEWHRMFEAASQAGKSTAPAASRMLSDEWGVDPDFNRQMRSAAMAERKAGFRPGDVRANAPVDQAEQQTDLPLSETAQSDVGKPADQSSAETPASEAAGTGAADKSPPQNTTMPDGSQLRDLGAITKNDDGSETVETTVGPRKLNSTDYDVGYGGSSQKDGTVVLQRGFDYTIKDGPLKGLDTRPFLAEHEAVERNLENTGNDYTAAHKQATDAEHAMLLDKLGLKPDTPEADQAIEAYESHNKTLLQHSAAVKDPNIAPDLLDLPYEHPHTAEQRRLLDEVQAAQSKNGDDIAGAKQANDERLAALKPRVDALSDEQARAALDDLGVKPEGRESPRDTLFAQHPNDIEQALKTIEPKPDTTKPATGEADAAANEQPRVDTGRTDRESAPAPADVEGQNGAAGENAGGTIQGESGGKSAPLKVGDRVSINNGKFKGREGTLERAGELSSKIKFDDGSAAAVKPDALRTAVPKLSNAEASEAQRQRVVAGDHVDQNDVHALIGDKPLGRKDALQALRDLKKDQTVPADYLADIPSKRVGKVQKFDPMDVARAARLEPEKSTVDAAARESAAHPENDIPEPTPAQHEANNYKQGHINLHGMDVTIQVPRGGMRRGTDRFGKEWEREASAHYGHIRGTDGGDGEPHDVYLGPFAENPNAKVYVIDQVKPGTKAFDEKKAMIGYANGKDARAAYEANFPKGLKTFGGMKVMSLDQFKETLKPKPKPEPLPPAVKGVRESKATLARRAAEAIEAKRSTEAAGQFDTEPSGANQLTEKHYQTIADAVRDATKDWGSNAPNVRVLRSADELPATAKREAADRYQYVRGYYDGKTAYIVARNIKDVDRALRTVVHEAVGHHGIEKIIDQHVKGGWDRLVADVQRLRDDKTLGSKAMRDTINEVERRYRNPDPTLFAKELLAVMSENGIKNGIIQRAVTALRAWVRQMFPNLKFSEADLHGLLRKSDEFIHTNDVAGDARRAAVRSLAFDRADQTDSPAFKKFFDGSKVVDKSGSPLMVHHGTGDDFTVFDPNRAGQSGEHATAPLGHFFTEDRKLAERYAENASEGRPADERVIDAYLSIRKPYEMPLREAQAIDTPAEARALRAKLEREGYDGIRIPEAKSWIAFDSGQAKSIDNRGTFDRNNPDIRFSMPDDREEGRARAVGVPRAAGETAALWRNDQPLKRDVDYRAAKAGDSEAAIRLIDRNAAPLAEQAKERWGSDVTFVAPHAEEATGKNAIPQTLAAYLAAHTGGEVDRGIVQTNRTFHTGADAMQRLLARSEFAGDVDRGRKYVLVDDVTTMGSTLADLAHYIQSKGGEVVGTSTLVNAAREGGKLHAEPGLLKQIERRFGDEIRKQFGIDPSALTASEARYLIGFRSANELAGRAAKAAQERVDRLGAKGIRLEEGAQEGVKAPGDKPSLFSMSDERDRAPEDFSKPQASVDRLNEVLSKPDETTWQRAKDWMRGKLEDFRPAALGALQTRHVLELMEDHPALKGAKQYGDLMQHLATDRNQLMAGSPDAAEHPENMIKRGGAAIAEDLRKYSYEKGLPGMMGRRRPEAKQLADVMHDATIYGLDPSEKYTKLTFQDSRGEPVEWSKEGIKERIKEIRGQMRGRPGDDKSLMMDEVKRLRNLPKREKLREERWPELVARYGALPEEGKRLYQETRDWYSQMRDETEKGLINRIDSMSGDLGEHYTRTMKDRIRLQFEQMRREGVYFPLNRDGDFWVSFSDHEGRQGFKMFESARDAAQAEKKLRGAGFTIDAQGRRDSDYKAKNAPSGTFVSDVIGILKKANAPENVQDDIYQLFLKTLPEMSMRKHSIHRQNIPGFSDDALRAFAKNSFHGAHQLARLRYAHQMQGVLDGMEMSMKNYRQGTEFGDSSTSSALDVARGDALLAELKKRNDFIMSPKDTSLANKANAIGFIYHLGASPASALVNLTQNAQVTLPALGAQHGFGKASRVLGAAVRDALRTFGNIDRTLTDPIERQAYNTLRARGDIDKTQTHTLAGLAEGNLLQSSPVWAKSMSAIGYMFHKAEVINRESAGMAAFRLEYAKTKDFQKSVQYASDIINGTHFDYSAANRPRLMQNNVARIALQFKNYSIGMTWAMYRNLYQAMKGETPEVRSVARRTLTGILGMTGLMAGTMGLPIINAMRFAGNAAHTLFGDDEPFDFNTEYRAWLAENLGDTAAKYIADGPINQLTGATFSNRVSLSNLWFQDADRELEGKDAYYAMLESIVGPLGGMVKNFYVGSKMVGDGQVERGIETMMPKFAKDAMKSLRFAHEGANTLRGDPIVPDVTKPEALIQALGFTPSRLFEQQQKNSALMNYQQQITDRRKLLMNMYALAVRSGADTDAAMAKIHQFNETYPEIAIKSDSIRQSLRARARYSDEQQGGIALNKKLAPRLREDVGVGASP